MDLDSVRDDLASVVQEALEGHKKFDLAHQIVAEIAMAIGGRPAAFFSGSMSRLQAGGEAATLALWKGPACAWYRAGISHANGLSADLGRRLCASVPPWYREATAECADGPVTRCWVRWRGKRDVDDRSGGGK